MKTSSKDVFEFREARIVCGNKGAGVGVMSAPPLTMSTTDLK